MRKIQSRLPVWVRKKVVEQRTVYCVSPLFSPKQYENHRYENAIASLRKDFESNFSGANLIAKKRNRWLWYLFRPDWEIGNYRCYLNVKKNTYQIKVMAVLFVLQEQLFVFLPRFESSFLALPLDSTRGQIQHQIEVFLNNWMQEQLLEDEDFNPNEYQAGDSDFVTDIPIDLGYQEAKFPFEKEEEQAFYAFLQALSDFDGAVELPKVGNNLSHYYPQDLKRAYSREDEIQRLWGMLFEQPKGSSFVLVAEEGAGKHSLLHEVIYRYEKAMRTDKKEMRPTQFRQHFWEVAPNRVISGMSIVGMWQKRIEAIIKHLCERIVSEAKEQKKKTEERTEERDKMVVDNAISLLRIGRSAQNSMTLADVLKPYIEKRDLQVILIATPEEWKVVQEKDRRFADLFQVFRLPEVTELQAVDMLLQQRRELEANFDVRIDVEGLAMLFEMRRNYFRRRALPGIVSKMLQQLALKHQGAEVRLEEVRAEFASYSGLHARIFDQNYVFEPREVEQELRQTLIGQDQAVEALEEALQLVKARLNNPNRPLATFLFIGPTGVGKTEAAKVLCKYLLGDSRKLMRFDMNEYIDEWSISRLVGDYSQPEGQLSSMVRYNPFGVLLLDEIEKAHPKVHDLLLQVLDDGRLTDALGRVVDFSNIIIIMTSNVGADKVAQRLGFETTASDDHALYRKAVERTFRPEFINRIDRLVIFRSLELEHVFDIAKLQIQSLLSRDGFVRRTTILNIEPTALEWVARRGYDGRMGGRALKRQIERDLTVFTAEQLIQNHGDLPVIFSINLEDEQLKPRIEILDFISSLEGDWLPQLPDSASSHRSFWSLFTNAKDLQQRINNWEGERLQNPLLGQSDFKENWLYYDFKNQVSEIQEKLQRIVLGTSELPNQLPEHALRLKIAPVYTRRNNDPRRNPERNSQKDIFFQKTAFEEFRYLYQFVSEEFSRQQSLYLQHVMDLYFAQFVFDKIQKEQSPQAYRLEIHPAITNQGQEEAAYLKKMYLLYFQALSLDVKDLDAHAISIEGYGASALIAGEIGYHFFYRPHQNPMPIRVQAYGFTANAPKLEAKSEIVRVYDLSLGETHKASTATDLRSGFSNQARLGAGEFKLFVYAAMLHKKAESEAKAD